MYVKKEGRMSTSAEDRERWWVRNALLQSRWQLHGRWVWLNRGMKLVFFACMLVFAFHYSLRVVWWIVNFFPNTWEFYCSLHITIHTKIHTVKHTCCSQLPTIDGIWCLHMSLTNTCSICNGHEETTNHILMWSYLVTRILLSKNWPLQFTLPLYPHLVILLILSFFIYPCLMHINLCRFCIVNRIILLKSPIKPNFKSICVVFK